MNYWGLWYPIIGMVALWLVVVVLHHHYLSKKTDIFHAQVMISTALKKRTARDLHFFIFSGSSEWSNKENVMYSRHITDKKWVKGLEAMLIAEGYNFLLVWPTEENKPSLEIRICR